MPRKHCLHLKSLAAPREDQHQERRTMQLYHGRERSKGKQRQALKNCCEPYHRPHLIDTIYPKPGTCLIANSGPSEGTSTVVLGAFHDGAGGSTLVVREDGKIYVYIILQLMDDYTHTSYNRATRSRRESSNKLRGWERYDM